MKLINDITDSKDVKKTINGLTKKFPNIHQFSNGDINKFVSLLRKVVYPYKYMDNWERFDETSSSLPKKAFYSELNLEEIRITYKDYIHAQKIFEEFILKRQSDYHDLYVHSNILLLADVFGNF